MSADASEENRQNPTDANNVAANNAADAFVGDALLGLARMSAKASGPNWGDLPLANTGRYTNPALFRKGGYLGTVTAHEGGTFIIRGSAANMPHKGIRSAVVDAAVVGVSYVEFIKAVAGKPLSHRTKRKMQIMRDPAGHLYAFVGEFDTQTKQFTSIAAAIPLHEAPAEEALSTRVHVIEIHGQRNSSSRDSGQSSLAPMLLAAMLAKQ